MKMPGMTMSPRPSMLKGALLLPASSTRGKSSLMGASRLVATDTMMGVANTKKQSAGREGSALLRPRPAGGAAARPHRRQTGLTAG